MSNKKLPASFLLLIAWLASCGYGSPVPQQTIATPSRTMSTLIATPAVKEGPPLFRDASEPVEKRVQDLLSRMTLAEKIGQMTQVENYSIEPEQVQEDAIGSVLSGGGGYGDNSPQAWRDLVESYERSALQTRLGIPLLFGIDAVHGHAHVAGAVYFPQNVGLGATRDPGLVEKIGRATAEQVAATGIPWNFSPVLAVPQDIRWGRTYEGFGENTDLVTELGTAYLKGLQGIDGKTELDNPQTVLATPKHYLGDGGTTFGSSRQVIQVPYLLDQGDMQLDEATLRALFLPPYKAAVEAGAQSVMVSFSSWNGVKMHAQRELLTGVLKGELGFEGFVVSDWQGIDQISDDYERSIVTGINAGIDMNMVPYDYKKFMSTLTQAVEKGDVPISRIDDAVRRILTVKFKKGLFEQPVPQTDVSSIVGNAEHRALARRAVQESAVLLQNVDRTLPLKKDMAIIFVAGEGANRTGYQNGGWTLEWQGVTGDAGGTSILDAVRQAVSSKTLVEFNRFGNFKNFKDAQGNLLKADTAIVVLAEPPYAEGAGDRKSLALSPSELEMIRRAKSASERVIVVLLSGRPLVITDALPLTDAFVAAWLPGSEGQGVTDLLFGDAQFSGKSPYTWPRTNAQLPFDFKQLKTDGCDAPLFPYGFGLTTNDPSPAQIECQE